jgi:hypothetical protein
VNGGITRDGAGDRLPDPARRGSRPPAARVSARRPFALTGPDGRLYLSDRPGTVGGHRRSKLYGRLDCRAALQAIERGGYVRHRVFFADEPTAKAAGYRPCAVCMPQQHTAWKAS